MTTTEQREAMTRRILAQLTDRGPQSLAQLANRVGSDEPHPKCLAAGIEVWDRLDELRAAGLVTENRDVGLGRPWLWSIVSDVE